jgi:hypothetical protein
MWVLGRLGPPLAAGIAMLALGGCGNAPAGDHAERVLPVKVRDFHISVPKRVPAGDLTVAMHNQGPDHHELIVVRAGSGKLPLRGDGFTVDEDGLGAAVVGALEPEAPGVHRLKVRLQPGAHYWFLCNMSGHYMGGMRTETVAR